MRIFILITAACLLVVSGCTATQKGAGVGAVVGGGAGYAIGKQSGHGGEGAAIGAVVGAIGGGLIGNKMDKKKFCPTCGRTFSSSTEYCPYDGATLSVAQ